MNEWISESLWREHVCVLYVRGHRFILHFFYYEGIGRHVVSSGLVWPSAVVEGLPVLVQASQRVIR